MLTSHLNNLPYSKFVLIEDTIEAKSTDLLDYLIKNRTTNRTDIKIHYFVFEQNFRRVINKNNYQNVIYHDFTSDVLNWEKTNLDFDKEIKNITQENCIIIIDSLAHLIYMYSIQYAYKILHEIKQQTNILQTISILHVDLLENENIVIKYFQYLSTFHIELFQNRLEYTYKKTNKKIIKNVEEYQCENGEFIVREIKKPNVEIMEEIANIPENLSTFKISLTDNDLESKQNFTLPYLPKNEDNSEIHYKFDEVDDWDEEDPDDDLDI